MVLVQHIPAHILVLAPIVYVKKKEIPYKEGILNDIGVHVGYKILYWRGGYLSGGTSLDTPRGRYTRAVTNTRLTGTVVYRLAIGLRGIKQDLVLSNA
jgi:hypothetical protein